MDVSSILNKSPAATQPVVGRDQLGKDDFLKLLTVQLRYQDPLNPMENTEFIAQMAQFSSLEQLQNMNAGLEKNLGAETQLHNAFQNNLVTSLVGKTVEIATAEIEFDGNDANDLAYRIAEGASKASLRILDARGSLVRELDLDVSDSYGTVEWDGKSTAGSEVPAGAYRALVIAETSGGQPVQANALKRVDVQAVRYVGNEARIWADGRELRIEELSGIVQPSPKN